MEKKIIEMEQELKAIKEQLKIADKAVFEFSKKVGELVVQLQEFENRLENAKEKDGPVFERVQKDKSFYKIGLKIFGQFTVDSICEQDIGEIVAEVFYNNNNYFHTKEKAQEVVDKINFLLKLERLHDTYCPDYVPDWESVSEEKWFINYDTSSKQYLPSITLTIMINTDTAFPNREIADKICDILNKELKK